VEVARCPSICIRAGYSAGPVPAPDSMAKRGAESYLTKDGEPVEGEESEEEKEEGGKFKPASEETMAKRK